MENIKRVNITLCGDLALFLTQCHGIVALLGANRIVFMETEGVTQYVLCH